MIEAIGWFKNIDIHSSLMYIYFNMYLMTKIYFECSIVSLIKLQDKYLRVIYEETILMKLGLSIKFLRKVLYMRKSALGVGLLQLSTVVEL